MASSYQFNPFTGTFDLVNTVTTPTLQQVTTAGATSNVSTTFSGGLASTDSGLKSWRFGQGVSATADESGGVGFGINALAAGTTVGHMMGFGNAINLEGNYMIGVGDTVTFNQDVNNYYGTVIGTTSTLRCDSDNLGAVAGIAIGNSSNINGYDVIAIGNDIDIGDGTEASLGDYQANIVIVGNQTTIPKSSGFTGNHSIFGNNNAISSGAITGSAIFGYANSIGHSDAFIFGQSITSSAANEHTFGGTTALYRFQGTFPDNNLLQFGTGKDATISYDGTNFILNPALVGGGSLLVGTTGDKNLQAYHLGLGGSAVATNRIIAMSETSSTTSGGLECVFTYTGSTATTRAMTFESVHSGSAATQITAAGFFTGTLGVKNSGTATIFGLNGIAKLGAVAHSSGTSNFQNQFEVQDAGATITGGTINARSVWAKEPAPFTGATTTRLWAIQSSGRLQVNNDKELIIGGADAAVGTTYFIRNSATPALELYTNSVKFCEWNNTTLTYGDARDIAFNTTTGTKIGTGTTQKIGFWNAAPVVQNTGWGSITNVTTDRAYDANATTVDELADVLGTLIAQLVTYGVLGA